MRRAWIEIGLGRYRTSYRGEKITPSEIYRYYQKAYTMGGIGYDENDISADYPQLRTMRALAKMLKGITFEELPL